MANKLAHVDAGRRESAASRAARALRIHLPVLAHTAPSLPRVATLPEYDEARLPTYERADR